MNGRMVGGRKYSIPPPSSSAADPHSFFADPEPSALLKAVPDSAACLMRIRIQLIFKLPYEEISVVENDEKNAQK